MTIKIELYPKIMITRLKDQISKGLPKKEAKEFNLEFLKEFNVGADLSLVIPRFLIKLLNRSKLLCDQKGLKATNKIIEMYENVLKGKEYSKAGAAAASGIGIGIADMAADMAADIAAKDVAYSYTYTANNDDIYNVADASAAEYSKQKTDLLQILRNTK